MLLTIDSAGRVLSQFTTDCPERGVTEVALAMGISKSKAHALLSSLTHVGLLRRTDHGRYRVGWRVLSLNRVLAETTEFRRQARPVMDALGERSGEIVHLGVLDDGQVMYVDRIKGRHAVQIDVTSLGKHSWAHSSAVGKVLLANTPHDALDAMIAQHGLPQVTGRTITDRASLDGELAEVRHRGIAVDHGEAVADVSGVAAPIIAPGPIVVAAIAIAAPTYRFTQRREVYTQMVVRAGLYVSQRLARLEEELAREAHAEIAAAVADEDLLVPPALTGAGVSQ